jgi:hypothetical protein
LSTYLFTNLPGIFAFHLLARKFEMLCEEEKYPIFFSFSSQDWRKAHNILLFFDWSVGRVLKQKCAVYLSGKH